jgi:DsbC/DsbD-like thiol-disulfide interchange protein
VERLTERLFLHLALALLVLVAPAAGCGASSTGNADEPPAGKTGAGAGEPEIPENLVRFHLVADVTRVAPGQELTIAARFDVEPTWHLYWVNPGETGLPTEVAIEAPDGFEVGPIQYPGPEKFESPGGIVSYGYSEHALLSAPVIAPDEIPESGARFAAEGSWLACREVCIVGKASAALVLPPASADEPSQPENTALFDRHRALLPRPLTELADARPEVKREDGRVNLAVAVPGAERLEYYPSRAEQLAFTGTVSVPGDAEAAVHVAYRSGPKPPETIRGVLAVVREGTPTYYQLDLPWPME